MEDIKLKCIDDIDDIETYEDENKRKFAINLMNELIDSYKCLEDIWIDEYAYPYTTISYDDYEILKEELDKRKKFLVTNFNILFLNSYEVKSQIYFKPTNVKSFLERKIEVNFNKNKEDERKIISIKDHEYSNNIFFSMDENKEDEDVVDWLVNDTEYEKEENIYGFFDDFVEEFENSHILESNNRQIYLEHNENKLLFHYMIEYLTIFFIVYKFDNKDLLSKSEKLIEEAHNELRNSFSKYGLKSMIYENSDSIFVYTLSDLYIAFQCFVEGRLIIK